jgi:hypothetical protein
VAQESDSSFAVAWTQKRQIKYWTRKAQRKQEDLLVRQASTSSWPLRSTELVWLSCILRMQGVPYRQVEWLELIPRHSWCAEGSSYVAGEQGQEPTSTNLNHFYNSSTFIRINPNPFLVLLFAPLRPESRDRFDYFLACNTTIASISLVMTFMFRQSLLTLSAK